MKNRNLIMLQCARAHALASKDEIHKCGAVIINGDTSETLSTGYNGPPKGFADCSINFDKKEFLLANKHNFPESKIYKDYSTKKNFMLHAEDNALRQARVYSGVNKILFCTHVCCTSCLMAAIKQELSGIYLEGRFVNSFPTHCMELLHIIENVKYPLSVNITHPYFVDNNLEPKFISLSHFLIYVRRNDVPVSELQTVLWQLLTAN